MYLSYLTYESQTNLVTVHEGIHSYGISWGLFKEEFNPPFDVENIYSISYEPDRNLYVLARGGSPANCETGLSVFEINWIHENFKLILTKAPLLDDASGSFVVTIRMKRAGRLFDTDFYGIRHTEELALGLPLSLTEQQYQEMLEYRNALRNISTEVLDTSDPAFVWPVCPEWMNLPPM